MLYLASTSTSYRTRVLCGCPRLRLSGIIYAIKPSIAQVLAHPYFSANNSAMSTRTIWYAASCRPYSTVRDYGTRTIRHIAIPYVRTGVRWYGMTKNCYIVREGGRSRVTAEYRTSTKIKAVVQSGAVLVLVPGQTYLRSDGMSTTLGSTSSNPSK